MSGFGDINAPIEHTALMSAAEQNWLSNDLR